MSYRAKILKMMGERSMTSPEIFNELNIHQSIVHVRSIITEMVKDRLLFISGKRKCNECFKSYKTYKKANS